MWASLFFMLIDNHWKTLYGCVLVATFATLIATLFVPESPKFLHGKRRYDEARKVITRIAKINKLTKFDTREGEPYPNSDGLLVYQFLFEEEVLENRKHQK